MPARFLLLVLSLLALSAAAPAGAAEKGIDTDFVMPLGPENEARTAALVDESGATWVGMTLPWSDAEPSKGAYTDYLLARVDRAAEHARAAGAKLFVIVTEAPEWASGSSDRISPPQDPQDFANFMGFLAARYKGRVGAWQLWNEPNHPHFWTPPADPGRYARLVGAAYPAIKVADPAAVVIAGGTAFNDWEFFQAMYAAEPQIGNYFDAAAVHPYTDNGAPPETVTRDDAGHITKGSFTGYREVRAVTAKPIWLTEFGWATLQEPHPTLGGVDEPTQADYLTRAYKLLEGDAYVQVAAWYNLRNRSEADSWVDQLGLLRNDFSPKLAWSAFKAYTPPQSTTDTTGGGGGTGTTEPTDTRRPTSLTLRMQRLRRGTHARERIRVSGRVSGFSRGSVDLYLERARRGGGWRTSPPLRVRIRAQRRYYAVVSLPRRVRWRAWSHYRGTTTAAPSTSRFVVFRTRSR